ncbi:DUF7007 domain-containing protein [Oceanidesulfovibrio marinus]|uniref:DUF7007 domain-containing protein n=1 Tax=Oceanidesulfovibrio marinus TaxID=370038 RepID=A0A6P1ZEX0_9BACT|nr:hypothetical protein [Oceanidesulfovibrio marinus]TVM31179.1 hypothetical protein DQK91_18895 [Oceanidesulfovibrio marinus]
METIYTSPWGAVQHQTEHGDGIIFVSTAGHGGFFLSPVRHAAIPKIFRDAKFLPGPWYEEDCDAAIVVYFNPDRFEERQVRAAEQSLRHWHKDAWNAWTAKQGQED